MRSIYKVFREGKQLEKHKLDVVEARCAKTKEPKGKVLLKVPATDSFSHLYTSTYISGIIFLMSKNEK